jgi:hypothetical protein
MTPQMPVVDRADGQPPEEFPRPPWPTPAEMRLANSDPANQRDDDDD